MRAIVIHAEQDLRLDPMPAPEPGPGEVRLRMARGGICGSDLHYFQHGGFGVVRIREPMALGHEISGVVESLGEGVSHLAIGQRVAVNPSQPCGACRFCSLGMRNHCLNMRFLGSAMRFPHVQGGFREAMTVPAAQAVPISDEMSLDEAAMAEPLAVCLHAASQAGPLQGRRVLVTGCGPIGALSILVARHAGASEVVATDIAEKPLAMASRLGATAVDAADSEALKRWSTDKGEFDVLFEASGNAAALRGAFEALRPGAAIVQIGLGGEMTLPMNAVVAKEFQIRGAFRFDREFELAVGLMGSGAIDVRPLISATLPMEQAREAFRLAGDRTRSMKVQIALDG